MEAVAELVGLVVALGTAVTSDHHSGRGHSRQTGQPDQLPAHAHRCVG